MYYVFTDNNGDWNNIIIVEGKNKKEAFDKFWIKMGYDNQEPNPNYDPHRKKDFEVRNLEDLLEDGIVILN